MFLLNYFASRNVDAAVVVVDMNDVDSIELAGAWKQDFVNKATNARMVTEKQPNGIKITHLEEIPCNPAKIPVMLLGNKFDIVEDQLRQQRLKRTLEKDQLENETAEQTIQKNFKRMKTMLGEKGNLLVLCCSIICPKVVEPGAYFSFFFFLYELSHLIIHACPPSPFLYSLN